jgi:uncharacterized protein YjbI with pentapeptide repeats
LSTLVGANFAGANLIGSNLDGAALDGSNLSGADLATASLYQTGLTDANLTGAVVTGTSFWETTSRGFTSQQLYLTRSYQDANLRGIGLGSNDLSGWDLHGQDLTDAFLYEAQLDSTNLAGTVVVGTSFGNTTALGFSDQQLYSTQSYADKDLRGIGLEANDLTGWNFADQDLENATFTASTMTDVTLTGAVVSGVSFGNTTSRGFTVQQLYSTSSYLDKNLRAIGLQQNDLTDWDLSGQDLSGASLYLSTLTGVDLTNANVAGVKLERAVGLTSQQLYSTRSHQQKDLRGIGLELLDLVNWDCAGQNLANSSFREANLSDADLTAANLANANLRLSSLANANLTGANVRNTTFQSAVGMQLAQFNGDTVYNQWTIFPADFDPASQGLTLVIADPGDLDGIDGLEAPDVDLLTERIRDESFMEWQFAMFDLNHDFAVDTLDLQTWVVELKGTWFGDADLNGRFNSSDLVGVFQTGQYEDGVVGNSTWSTGDWNGDTEFTTGDFVAAFQDGGYEQGPRTGVAVVPEPSGRLLAVLAGWLWLGGCRGAVRGYQRSAG